MGIYDALPENNLKDNSKLAAHLVHSLMHMAFHKQRVYCNSSMTVDVFYTGNREFIEAMCARYKEERGYSISEYSIRKGIEWFLEHRAEL